MEAELQRFFQEKNWRYVAGLNEDELKIVYNLYIHNDTNFDKKELTPLCLTYLGLYHQRITIDYEETKKYYLRAIEGGDIDAMINLG